MRLIDADELIKRMGLGVKVFTPVRGNTKSTVSLIFVLIKEAIVSAPTINPEDLRPKGRWVERHDLTGYKYECSACSLGADLMTDFCPNNGAKMEAYHERD